MAIRLRRRMRELGRKLKRKLLIFWFAFVIPPLERLGRRTRHWLLRIAIFVGLPLLLIIGGGWYWLTTSLPQISGTLAIAGPKAPVEILRDRHGIPHIFAKNDADALFALGYVHAQDRLWQMEETRRAGTGRLSEVFGRSTRSFDRITRTLGLGHLAEAALITLDRDARALLQAYTDGVNAYIAGHRGAWPPEFTLLGDSPEPWRPADSLVWAELMAVQLSGHWHQSVLRARLLKRLTPEEVDELWPPYPDSAPATLAADPKLSRGLPLAGLAAAAAMLDGRGASNAWVVNGRRSETGKPILANDPHLGFSIPILWYLVTIETPGLHLAGVTVPGVPLIVLGHNDRIAWGMTTTGGSVEDLFVEKLDANDANQYATPDGAKPFRAHTEQIRIAGAETETLTVRETRHGPVISDLYDDLKTVADRGTVVALAAPWLDASNKTAEAIFRLNRAANWDDFIAALRDFDAPEQNVTYADVDGNIGFYAAGRVPIRKEGDGRLPVAGSTGDYDWTGFVPFDALPHGLNPGSGRFVNANNRVTPPGYAFPITRDGWDLPYRAERILSLLDAMPKATLDGFAGMQADIVSLAARDLMPLLLTASPTDANAKSVLERMRLWDGGMDRTRLEPLVFSAWLRELERGLFAAKLGDIFPSFWALRPTLVKSVFESHQAWCVPSGNVTAEACAARSTEALERALAWIAQRFGREPSWWQWGEAHLAEFRHRIFDHVPVLSQIVDVHFPADGGFYTINRGAFDLANEAEPFGDVHGAGFRAIYDLADLKRSRFMIATGESGNPLSRHFSDLVAPWRDFAYVQLDQSRDELAREGEGLLTLVPK